MGFLGLGDERLIIESRFCGDKEDYFFQYLLNKFIDFPNLLNLESDINQDNRLDIGIMMVMLRARLISQNTLRRTRHSLGI